MYALDDQLMLMMINVEQWWQWKSSNVQRMLNIISNMHNIFWLKKEGKLYINIHNLYKLSIDLYLYKQISVFLTPNVGFNFREIHFPISNRFPRSGNQEIKGRYRWGGTETEFRCDHAWLSETICCECVSWVSCSRMFLRTWWDFCQLLEWC